MMAGSPFLCLVCVSIVPRAQWLKEFLATGGLAATDDTDLAAWERRSPALRLQEWFGRLSEYGLWPRQAGLRTLKDGRRAGRHTALTRRGLGQSGAAQDPA
jgi:hypothetical protein